MGYKGNILTLIEEEMNQFPGKQRKLCEYILDHHRDIYIMTVAELSEKSQVGRATVMRLIESLGCESFSEFKRKLNSASVMAISSNNSGPMFYSTESEDGTIDNVTAYFNKSYGLLSKTVSAINREELSNILNLILSANSVHVLGLRTSRGIAEYFSNELESFVGTVTRLGDNESMAYDRVLRMGKGDVVFIITTLPMTKTTLKIAELCHSMYIPVICITDGENSPVLPFATAKIVIPRDKGKKLSILPMLSVLEVIINELGLRMAPMFSKMRKERDQFLLENDIITY